MRYFKKDLEVYAFEENQLHLVDNTYSAMNAEEVDRHINPQNYMSDEEKELFRLTQFKPLTRRQFKLALLENGLLSTVEQMIESIEDPTVKARIQIEYSESERFERTNDSVKYILGVLDLTTERVDEMWKHALIS
jgi:hypothetical protein